MKCTNCNRELLGLFFVWHYPKNKMVMCEACLSQFANNVIQPLYKYIKSFIETLLIYDKEILKFQKSNQKTQCDGDTSTDKTPDS